MDAAEPSNAELASALEEYAALLDLAGAGYYSARAFRQASELIRAAPLPVAPLVRAGTVTQLRGIGRGVEARLRELIDEGRIAELDELRKRASPELAAFLRSLGLSADLGVRIGAALEIETAAELRSAAAEGRLRDVPGIGPRTEERLLAALERGAPPGASALLLPRAQVVSDRIATAIGGIAAGGARRWEDSPDRLSVVVASTEPEAVRARFAALPEIVSMIDTDVGLIGDGIPVELVIAAPSGLGTALVRATGSDEYVAALEPLPVAADERDVYRRLSIPYRPPELREAAASDAPAQLVELADIRGDLHCHTVWSDGKATVLAMAQSARSRGYEYLAICDHTPNVRVVPGLDAEALRRQADEIAAANESLAPFRVLRGVECDILSDGGLDLPDDVLSGLDWVQISLHAGQRARRAELTARVVHGMRHPAVRCLSHPTGRLIGHRPENALDLEQTVAVALETGVALEVNGLPNRLDLSGEHVRVAVAAGVRIVCSTDAHSVPGLEHMALSVHTARRGGAERTDVLNTLPLGELMRRRPGA